MGEFLKCDADGCDHVESVTEITEAMVGMPCPKCGASLLTQSDWDAWRLVFRPGIDLARDLGLMTTDVEPGTPGAVRVHYHDGELNVRVYPGAVATKD